MFRRPLIWILGAVIIGEIVAFLTGNVLYDYTSLDDAYAAGLSRVVIEGYITEISNGGGTSCVLLESCDVYRAGNGGGSAADYSTKYDTHGISIYSDELSSYGVGKHVRVKGSLSEFPTPDNPGEFNKWLHYRTQGVDYSLKPDSIYLISEPEEGFALSKLSAGIKSFLLTVKSSVSDSIDRVADTSAEAGLFKAILLGDKSLIEDDTYNLFRICGIAHVLAISGLHLSIIGAAVLKLLRKAGLKRLPASIISDLILLLYVVMIDGRASAWRAFIMFTLSLLAPLIGRTYDLLSALGTAGLLMLASQPLYALDSGFLLSFGAMAGIGILLPRLNELATSLRTLWWKRKIQNTSACGKMPRPGFLFEKILTPLLMSFSIQLMTLPVVACIYYEITPYGILLNLLAVPVMSVVMISVISGSIFGIFSVTFGSFFIGLAHYIFKGLLAVCEIFSRLPFSEIVTGQPGTWQVVLYYTFMAGILLIADNVKIIQSLSLKSLQRLPSKIRHMIFRAGALASLVFYLPMLLLPFLIFRGGPGFVNLAALYVGQGDCTVITLPNNHAVIMDCGSQGNPDISKNVILPYLKSQGIDTVDMIFLSHADDDHTNGLAGLISDSAIQVKAVGVPDIAKNDDAWTKVLELFDQTSSPAEKAYGGDTDRLPAEEEIYFLKPGDFADDGPARFHVIWPFSDALPKDENDSSMVIYMTISNDGNAIATGSDFTALFTGDIGVEAESQIAAMIEAARNGTLEKTDTAGLASLKQLSYLKCAHHGSRFSSSPEFLACVSPKVTTISAGRRNTYGHPAPETLDRLLAIGTKVFCTKNSGAILTDLAHDGTCHTVGYKDIKNPHG